MARKLTNWLTICTAGPTVDGREVREKDLEEIAETYDTEEYGAVINREHWYGNYGDVVEVKLGKDKKKRTILQGRLKPNAAFEWLNKKVQACVYTSIEITRNFAGTGKAYLSGLALTDRPAALGTTRIELSANNQIMGDSVERFSMEEAQELRFEDEATEEQAKSLFSKFITFFNSHNPNSPIQQIDQKTETEEDYMSKELEAKFDKFANSMESMFSSIVSALPKEPTIEEKFAAAEKENAELKEKLEKFTANPDGGKKPEGEKTDEKTQKLSIEERFDALEQKFSKFLAQPGDSTQFGKNNGDNENEMEGVM